MAGALKESWWATATLGRRRQRLRKGDRRLTYDASIPPWYLPSRNESSAPYNSFYQKAQNSSTNIRPKQDTTPMSFNTVNGQSVVHPPGTPLTIEREQALASQSSDELQRNQSSCTVQLHSQEILQEIEPWCCKENRWWLPGLGPGAGTPGR